MSILLVVDDDPLTLDCFRYLFPKGKATVLTAGSAAEGLSIFTERRPDVVILDIRLPDLSGLDAFHRFHEADPKAPIILITGHTSAETAIDAMRLGAYDYVVKPLDPVSLREVIARAFEVSRLMHVPATVAGADSPAPSAGDTDMLVGDSPPMREVYKAIGRVAPLDVTVLLLGESGTGKELVARAIYTYSKRAQGPFLAVNCAAIPENLLESELFGHEKGAFTGADRKRIGKFEQCDRGTLFLDEIGDMTPATQAKVLRVLQDRSFQRVGGSEMVQTNVRIIAATNRDLDAMIAAGEFRQDLYYRLNVYVIRLPPLRDRGEDQQLLAEHFVRRFGRELGKDVHGIAPETASLLRRHPWPGNVRELQSVLKQAIVHASGPLLVPEFFPDSVRTGDREDFGRTVPGTDELADIPHLTRFIETRLRAGSTNLHEEFLALTERQLLLHVLRYVDNNLTQAARILGISRGTMRNKLGQLGITIDRSTALEED